MSQPSLGLVAEVWLATPDAAAHLDPSSLSPTERAELAGLHTERRRLDWASSRALLGAVARAGGNASSLSHSHGFAALAFASGAVSVGVDLERLVPRDFLGMAAIAFAADELEWLAAIQDSVDRCGRFYELWTLKEAFAKALRLPLVDVMRQTCFAAGAPTGVARVPTERCWSATVYAPRPDLRLAFARVADTDDLLAATVGTSEWPTPRAVAWPVVRSLRGQPTGTGRVIPCAPQPP